MKFLLDFIQTKRNSTKGLVRLGEYDISKTSDGEHQDIPIDYILRHEAFDGYNMINDIAIVYLKQDVEFSGEY